MGQIFQQKCGPNTQNHEPCTTSLGPQTWKQWKWSRPIALRGADIPPAINTDEDQNQPPLNQWAHCSARVSRQPKDLSPHMRGTSHILSKRPATRPQPESFVGPWMAGECVLMEEHYSRTFWQCNTSGWLISIFAHTLRCYANIPVRRMFENT